MSTPSRKPSHPIELSDYLAPKEREHGEPQPHPVASEHGGSRSPYAPRPGHLPAGAPPNAPGPDLGGASAYAPKRSRPTPFSQHPPIDAAEEATGDQVPLCPDDVPDGARTKHVLDSDPAVSLQPGAADDPQSATQDGERHDPSIDDHDLERLEASVRWLQRRQAAAMRLPRATGLPPLRSSLSDAMLGGVRREPDEPLRSPLRSLEPTRLKPPPLRSQRNPNAMLAVAVACILMAGALYSLIMIGPSPSSQATSKSQIASVAPLPASSTLHWPASVHLEQPAPIALQPEASAEADKSPGQPAPAQAASALPPQPVAMLRPEAASSAPDASPPAKAVRTLDPEEVSLLIKQGEKHIAVGDVIAARTIFQRAADAGDAGATLALAATYDPAVLAKLGVMGMGTDVEKARTWYRIAESLGSAEAKHRLQLLGKR